MRKFYITSLRKYKGINSPSMWVCKQFCASPLKILSAPSGCTCLSCFSRHRRELQGFYKIALRSYWSREGKTPPREPLTGQSCPPCAIRMQPQLFSDDFVPPTRIIRSDDQEFQYFIILRTPQTTTSIIL